MVKSEKKSAFGRQSNADAGVDLAREEQRTVLHLLVVVETVGVAVRVAEFAHFSLSV
jgi:hypothetical protein